MKRETETDLGFWFRLFLMAGNVHHHGNLGKPEIFSIFLNFTTPYCMCTEDEHVLLEIHLSEINLWGKVFNCLLSFLPFFILTNKNITYELQVSNSSMVQLCWYASMSSLNWTRRLSSQGCTLFCFSNIYMRTIF